MALRGLWELALALIARFATLQFALYGFANELRPLVLSDERSDPIQRLLRQPNRHRFQVEWRASHDAPGSGGVFAWQENDTLFC